MWSYMSFCAGHILSADAAVLTIETCLSETAFMRLRTGLWDETIILLS